MVFGLARFGCLGKCPQELLFYCKYPIKQRTPKILCIFVLCYSFMRYFTQYIALVEKLKPKDQPKPWPHVGERHGGAFVESLLYTMRLNY